MRFEIYEDGDGAVIDGPNGSISVGAEPVKGYGDVHINGVGSGGSDRHCEISGDTYVNKGLIKELPYGSGGTEWTGEFWQVNKEETSRLAAVMLRNGVSVTVHSSAIASDRGWGVLRHEINIESGPTSNEKMRIMVGPDDELDGVSRSWAEDAARVGGYDSTEEFAEEFGLNVVDDEEAAEELDRELGEVDRSVFSTDVA